jgi:hypothetical protein
MQQRLTPCRQARRAIEDFDFVLAQPPALAAELLFIRAAVLASRGQHIAAAAAAERLRTLDPKNPGFLYDAACGYALCVPSVGQGKSQEQLTSDETAARKRYARLAIETLDAVVQLGFKNVTRFETDPDLAAIRQEEAYCALVARLKALRKPGK